MKKKNKPDARISTSKAPELKHSPFANLGGRDALPEGPTPRQDLPAPDTAPTRRRGRLVLRRETKHRGGKAVVIIRGFAELSDFGTDAIEELARECKRALACGGTVENGEIVLQGDRPAEVAALLRDKGFAVAGVTG